jgi:hypothetical protein
MVSTAAITTGRLVNGNLRGIGSSRSGLDLDRSWVIQCIQYIACYDQPTVPRLAGPGHRDFAIRLFR